ncbi:type VI secretion system tip protein VgrG, partial [Pandoraea sp. NPDC090278]
MLASEAPARSASNVHQFYSLEIPQTPSATLADVLSFEGTHAFGEPTRYVVRFTHVDHELSRLDFVNKPASFVIRPPRENAWSAPPPERRVQGVITGFARL